MIFWKHLKGFYQLSSSDALWSFIRFKNKVDTDSVVSFDNVPELHLSTTNEDDFTTNANCGHLITEKATGQSFTNLMSFKHNIRFINSSNKRLEWGNTSSGSSAYIDGNYTDSVNNFNQLTIHAAHSIFIEGGRIVSQANGWNHYMTVDSTSYKIYFGKHSNSSLLADTWATISSNGLSVSVGKITSTGNIEATTATIKSKDVEVSNQCEAKYFNATSDRRAKTDIQPLLIDALELVRKTNLYSFRYKETDTPSIGIIAQDVQNVEINGFKLVDNEEATGKDLDYMTIHESKLTYILWKAVQEQQKEIEELKKEIAELKKN